MIMIVVNLFTEICNICLLLLIEDDDYLMHQINNKYIMNNDERWSTDARERRADVTNVERFRLKYIDEITFNEEGAADQSIVITIII